MMTKNQVCLIWHTQLVGSTALLLSRFVSLYTSILIHDSYVWCKINFYKPVFCIKRRSLGTCCGSLGSVVILGPWQANSCNERYQTSYVHTCIMCGPFDYVYINRKHCVVGQGEQPCLSPARMLYLAVNDGWIKVPLLWHTARSSALDESNLINPWLCICSYSMDLNPNFLYEQEAW